MKNKLAIAAFACLGLMLPSAMQAQTLASAAVSPSGSSGGAKSCGETTGPTSCGASGPASKSDQSVDVGGGNPINVITGNKYQREVDLPALPGVLGLELVRHYNSQFSGVGFPNGIMGRGWKLSYETELHVVGHTLQVVQADGARLIFSRDLLDSSRCGTSRASDGHIAIRRGPLGDEYVWTWPNGRRLSFDHHGKLVQIAVPTGEFVTLQHDAGGHLVQVTDPQGRQLKLNYAEPTRGKNQPPHFTGVQSIDTPVGRFAYEYGSAAPKGTQVDKIQLVANLVKVHLPTHYEADKPAHPLTTRGTTTSSVSRTYHYEDARFPTLLTGISVSGSGSDGQALNQRISTYGYDPRGWAVRSEHEGLQVELAVLERASLSELPGATPGRSVLVHGRTAERPEGRRLEIRSAMVAGDYRITETRGEPCAAALPCPRANMRYRYDAKGRLIEEIQLDPQGQPLLGVRTAYDPMDRVLRVSQLAYQGGKPGTERWMVRYEYGESGEQPTLIAKPSVVPGREHQWRMKYNAHGQAVDITETAWRPAFADQPAEAIQRTLQHAYRQINGRSVLASTDGPLPGAVDTTRYQWDAHGDFVQASSYPMGLSHSYRRDSAGRVTLQTPPDRVDITWTYLPTGEPSSWQRGPAMAKAQYDARQRPTRLELPDGEVRRLAYTDQEGVAMASNAGWARWVALPPALDARALEPDEPAAMAAASPLSSVKPEQPQAERETGAPREPWPGVRAVVDDFSRLVATYTSATGWDIRRYDESGQLLERRLADGTVWRWQRDALGRIQAHEVSRPGSATQRTQLRYEGVHLVGVEHPQQSERYAYDALGRVQAHAVVRHGLAYTERYEYDQADRLIIWRLPEGGSLRYSWGVGRQIKAIAQDDGRASAVLGERLSSWLGLGQHRIIEPLPADGPAKPAIVTTPPNRGMDGLPTPLQQALQAERGYRWGNGVALHWHLNGQGQLAHMRWELPDQRSGREWLGDWITAWLPQARAQTSQEARAGASAADPAAAWPVTQATPLLMQNSFDYDALGRMQERSLEDQEGGLQRISFAYDGLGRLLLAQPVGDKTAAVPPEATQPEYYAYDNEGRLRIARWQGQDHDWRGVNVQRDATGLPQRISGMPGLPARTLAYSADRRLAEVRQAGTLVVRYTHDTYGLRIAKTMYAGRRQENAEQTQYLWQGLKLVAETRPQVVPAKEAKASHSKLARRYIYAHNVPVALIDYPDGAETQGDEGGVGAWLVAVWRWISCERGELRYVHANEIGTPVAVTDAKARVIWRARPTAYGVIAPQTVAHTAHTPEHFALNLRLPGQYFDVETGWHDNVLRTYDPQRGEYLEPDPIGPVPNWRSGQVLTQPYAYANHDPLTHADPSGLILFAFDGTGNSDPAQPDSALSNVVKFRDLYLSDNRGVNYITGVGTKDPQSGIEHWGPQKADMGGNYTGPKRIEQMVQYFNTSADNYDDARIMEVDIVGFSRGAAQARDFANRIVANTKNGVYQYQDKQGKQRCQKIDFRFMGLWDTVLSTNHSNYEYQLAIPSQFAHVAQAIALNEFRGAGSGAVDSRALPGSYGNFPLESIMAGMTSTPAIPGKIRIERGFLGSHSDIGGGYAPGQDQLAQVALVWMVEQARDAGVEMKAPPLVIISNPIVHDKSDNQFARDKNKPSTVNEDRQVRYMNGSSTTQKKMVGTGMTYSDTLPFIHFNPGATNNPGLSMAPKPADFSTGTVNMAGYLQWLRNNGYDLGALKVQ